MDGVNDFALVVLRELIENMELGFRGRPKEAKGCARR